MINSLSIFKDISTLHIYVSSIIVLLILNFYLSSSFSLEIYGQNQGLKIKEQERKQYGKNISNIQPQEKKEHKNDGIFDSSLLNSILIISVIVVIGVSAYAGYKIYRIRKKSNQNMNKRKWYLI